MLYPGFECFFEYLIEVNLEAYFDRKRFRLLYLLGLYGDAFVDDEGGGRLLDLLLGFVAHVILYLCFYLDRVGGCNAGKS